MVSRRTFIKQIGLATAGIALTLAGCDKESDIEQPIPEPEPDPEPDPEHGKPISEADESEPYDPNMLWGIVYDANGYLVEGVVVSDGYTCVVTDEGGRYELSPNSRAVQINITIPAKYQITLADGYPDFWKTLVDGQKRYDFLLTPLQDGIEKEFNLVCIADPQTQTDTHATRLETMYIPDVKEEVAELSAKLPTYGVILGDVIWNNASNYLKETMLPRMKTDWSADNTGLTTFVIIGNHDHTYRDADDIDAQRDFEATFGPINYSFDRGNVHFVCMDSCYFYVNNDYYVGFRDDQVEWLRQDLSYVSGDKLIIFCTHCPIRNRTGSGQRNVQNVLGLLDQFPGYHIMSGHIHTTVNYDTYATHYEHNHGALCGAFWTGTVCADGTPNGYAVYTVKDTEMTNWYYRSPGYGKDYQIRLYHGQDVFMPDYSPNFQFYFDGEKRVIANVFNADGDWTVEIYEDGAYLGKMNRFTDRDAWAAGYFMGVIGKKAGGDYDKSSVDHLYYYNLDKNSKEANVEVVATDKFGNVYRQTKFTSNDKSEWPEF